MIDNLAAALDEVAPAAPAPPRPANRAARQELVDVSVDQINPDPANPREDVGDVTELANSMAAAGLLQPVIARRETHTGRLYLVAGHRRLAAAKLLKWSRVATVVRRDMPADRVLAAMLIENGQRAALDPIEEARALARLRDDHDITSHADLANMIGRTQVHVSGRLALLALPPDEQEALRAGQDNLGSAIRRARLISGRVRKSGSTGGPHLSSLHPLHRRAAAACEALKHKKGGRNSVGGVACGECWEAVIRANEREELNRQSNQRGRCVLCDADREHQHSTSPDTGNEEKS